MTSLLYTETGPNTIFSLDWEAKAQRRKEFPEGDLPSKYRFNWFVSKLSLSLVLHPAFLFLSKYSTPMELFKSHGKG